MPTPGDMNIPAHPQSLPKKPRLSGGCVDLWIISLDTRGLRLKTLADMLSADETERADRFLIPGPRDAFITSRAALRCILARYLGEKPQDIRLKYTPQGKPELAIPHTNPPLRFNLSHSGGYGLFGVACNLEIGTDIERIRPLRSPDGLARRQLTAVEFEALGSLPESEKTLRFFTLWTRKEALLKASGGGLKNIPMCTVDVSDSPESTVRFPGGSNSSGVFTDWTISDIDAGPEFRAAVAVEGRGREVRMFRGRMGDF